MAGLVATRLREEDRQDIDIRVFPSVDDLALQSAVFFKQKVEDAISKRGRFTVLLSGGHAPIPFFRSLPELSLPWENMELFWGDERMVPSDSPDSNFLSFKKNCLDHVQVPAQNIHRVKTELGDPQKVAEDYRQEIRKFFPDMKWPRFDFALQGLGPDGHTASLFPGSQTEHDSPEWVIAPYVEKLGAFRISVSLGVLNAARAVFFLVSGAEKAEITRQVLRDPREHRGLLPSQRVQPTDGELYWFLDQAAAERL
jgi:6-phosphogluconolactonase